ncbi:hypothetical protein AXF42_Ash003974 [Apostasia shenzhenica]|uniref:Uncharacterized protein n=1 Tax=Apostasia shenzhenica TaxID=1088818 RepID=A0A2I0AIN6_9ASPA|nr:hypothetical protein AXF42_Ash003974 [Apostasia shenzhenica]
MLKMVLEWSGASGEELQSFAAEITLIAKRRKVPLKRGRRAAEDGAREEFLLKTGESSV